ncbi:MAG: hypothetical protein R3208_06695 [Ketobacteraceae bacterium]|nr:hypothetical protein [Ketobacteraceae bacterium]
MFEHRSWILQRSNIELLRECQRLINEQFAEKLSLAQNDLIEKIFLFSLKSTNPRFNDTVERLRHSLIEASYDLSALPGQATVSPQTADPDPEQAEPERVSRASEKVYRGQRVVLEVNQVATPGDEARSRRVLMIGEPMQGTVKKQRRVYRGHVIEG